MCPCGSPIFDSRGRRREGEIIHPESREMCERFQVCVVPGETPPCDVCVNELYVQCEYRFERGVGEARRVTRQ